MYIAYRHSSIAAGRGQGACAPRRQQRMRERGCGNFLRHDIYILFYELSVEVGMGMEGQIMCIEQCTFYMSSVAFLSPQNAPNHWRLGLLRLCNYTFTTPTSKAWPLLINGGEERGREGARNPRAVTEAQCTF